VVSLSNIQSNEVSSAPDTEPVTRTEAKAWIKLDTTTDDTLIDSLITAARIAAENFTGTKFITQTVKQYLTDFPGTADELVLRFSPVQSITSVAYVDADGNNQTLTTYNADLTGVPARLWPNVNTNWPETKAQLKAVTITYVCGYGTAGYVPGDIKNAILFMIASWYERREESAKTMPNMSEYLLTPYRVHLF